MAATVAKVVFQFKSRGQGFSEFYLKAVPNGQVTDIISAINALAALMAAIRGAQTNLYRARVSDLNNPRKGFLLPFGAGGIYGNLGEDSEDPNVSLNLRILAIGTPPQSALRFMRGCWDSVITTGGLYTPTPIYTTKVNQFIAGLTAGSWSFAPANKLEVDVNAIDFAGYPIGADKLAKITFAQACIPGNAGQGFLGPQRLGLLSGGRFKSPSIPRRIRISADSTSGAGPLYPVGSVADWLNQNNAYFGGAKVIFDSDGALSQISNAEIEGVGKRASGRPSDLQRGRRYVNPITKLFG